MSQPYIIFVPGKNPKPLPENHRPILWRTLLEGVRRAEPEIKKELSQHFDQFLLAAWNYIYYHQHKDINRELAWIDAVINQHGPSKQDIQQANSIPRKLHHILYAIVDHFPFLIKFVSEELRTAAEETKRYFRNIDNIACEVRETLKKQLRPALQNKDNILVIGHSMGSIIAYDTLWELSHTEKLSGKIDFLTIGSPLGLKYVKRRLKGYKYSGKKKYPTNINHWVNISSVGDITSLSRLLAKDFSGMLDLGVINSIEDHCEGIYNFFHNESGLNCHRSYGYLVNPVVGKVIADWWQENKN